MKRQLGAVSVQALTKLGTVRRKGFLAAIAVKLINLVKRGCVLTYQVYKASVQRARYGLLERTADLRREDNLPVATTAISMAKLTDDQWFTLVSNQKAEVGKRGPGCPRKHPMTTGPLPQLTAPSGSNSRPQSSLFGTESRERMARYALASPVPD